MATIKYFPAMTSDIVIPSSAATLLDHNDTSAELMTGFGSDTVVFSGQGFAYEDDKLVGGNVTEIVYKAFEADRYVISDIDWDVTGGLPGVFNGGTDLFAGDDIFIGSRVGDSLRAEGGNDYIRGGLGQDIIAGGEGDDRLRGGRDSDTFYFRIGDGMDTIVDFDTSGRRQDVIRILDVEEISELTVRQRHGDVVIEFGGEDKIILRHVDLDDLSPRNFDLG
jgi:Ca2+-binding RTX toxin-like protein